jgi:microcystin-dependent protein
MRCGRVLASLDDMGNTAAGRLTSAGFGSTGTVLGLAGGGETQTLTLAQIPSHFHSAGIFDPGHVHSYNLPAAGPQKPNSGGTAPYDSMVGGGTTGSSATGVRVNSSNGLDTTYSAGGGAAHPIIPPTLLVTSYIKM